MNLKPLAALAVVFVLAACGEQNAAPAAPIAASSASVPATALGKAKAAYDSAFIASFRKSFVEEGISSCIQGSRQGEKARKPCECIMTTLEKGLSDDEIFALSKGSEPKDMEQRMDKAAAQCK